MYMDDTTILKKLLEEDGGTPAENIYVSDHITCLLAFCLRSTYFTFQGRYYEQQEGAAMGSPISPIVANLHMEDFEKEAINSSPHPPCLWRRFVDDTSTIIKSVHKRSFLDHINSVDQHIQFTSEDSRPDGSMPFLDILITPNEDGSLVQQFTENTLIQTIIYRGQSSHSVIRI